jgi:outer membrane protein assembly factor BamD (BamD/ComL family)
MKAADKKKIEPRFSEASKLWKEKKLPQAIKIFKGLDGEFPNQPAILGMLGAIYYSTRNYAAALGYFEKVTKLNPRSELASRALFHALIEHERNADALAEARRFIRLNGLTKEYALIMEELDESHVFDKQPGFEP